MKVIIQGEEKYIHVSTVTLQKEASGATYPFHCVVCGNTHAIVGGKVTKIYPILEPAGQITVVTTCKSCKSKYAFQESVGTTTDVIRVLLNPKIERQPFYCYLGGGDNKALNKILEYERGQIYSYIENRYMTHDFFSRCGNPDCMITYQFTRLM